MPRLKWTTEKWDIILARTPLLHWNLMAHMHCHSDTLFSCAHKFPRKYALNWPFFPDLVAFHMLILGFFILFFDNTNRNISGLLYQGESGQKEKINSYGLFLKSTILWVLALGRHKSRKITSVFIVCFLLMKVLMHVGPGCKWCSLNIHRINKVLHRNKVLKTFG